MERVSTMNASSPSVSSFPNHLDIGTDTPPKPGQPQGGGHPGPYRTAQFLDQLAPYLKPNVALGGTRFPEAHIPHYTAGMRANAHYFSHPKWMEDWLHCVHRYPELRERWHAAIGSVEDKVIVDIGCGPGNLLATLGDKPRVAIGIDIAPGSLELAIGMGYVPLLADAHDLPLRSGIADVVAINGSLHHCDDMTRVLAEAARLVRPAGHLVIDHDPQQSAWAFRGLALLSWRLRLPIYRWLRRGGHTSADNEQYWALATELHHRPGDGVTEKLLRTALEPRGFDVDIYPHSHHVGREVLSGETGRAPLKLRIAQRLSGIDPDSDAAALSLLCVATRR